MASATSSRAPKRLEPLAALTGPLEGALASGPVPLLVLRLPEFERIAWRDGKRAARRLERLTTAAFVQAATRTLRTGDLYAHDPGSDVFAIAMSALRQDHHDKLGPSPVDIRAVLERVSAAISLRCELRVETGWSMLTRLEHDLERDIAIALERGARERERYEFFSAIGHELRTPLTSIRGYLETLLDDDVDATTSRRFLETARREALRMGRLLEGMFEFSLLDLSSQAFEGHSCDLDVQMQQACEVVRPLAQSRGVTLQRPTLELRAAIDPDACLQLMVNLLDNAVKYGRDGGIVRISACKRGAEAIVGVDDDGPGVAPGERESIFGLRVRGSSAAARPGTGIGLAIVKMIAERAGGTIRITESQLGGARFEVSLPLAS